MTIHRTNIRRGVLRLLPLAATIAISTTATAAQSPNAAPLSAAQRRAMLANPAHVFWKAKAPDTVTIDVETSKGALTIELIREWAPRGVDRFYNLARAGYFDDSRFYRVIPYYIAQFGLAGNPSLASLWRGIKIRADSLRTQNLRGTLTYAQYNPRDRATDVFINLRDNANLDSLHFAPIGRVTEGMEVADSLYAGYGDIPSLPPPMGNPRRLYGESNKYLDKEFPKLDHIVSIKIRP
ncbi:MAG: peptidylprolyl isomerase [Gemmatimonadaceae bacterium]